MPPPHPLCTVAHIGSDEIVLPADGEGRAAVNCHAQLPRSHACKREQNLMMSKPALEEVVIQIEMFKLFYKAFYFKIMQAESVHIGTSLVNKQVSWKWQNMVLRTHRAPLRAVGSSGSLLPRHWRCWQRWRWGDTQSTITPAGSGAEWCLSPRLEPRLTPSPQSPCTHQAALGQETNTWERFQYHKLKTYWFINTFDISKKNQPSKLETAACDLWPQSSQQTWGWRWRAALSVLKRGKIISSASNWHFWLKKKRKKLLIF